MCDIEQLFCHTYNTPCQVHSLQSKLCLLYTRFHATVQ